ncbi:hypothetical protein CAPTEDRAFT_176545 [Capitella teleta]|uniref:HTH TFE/IIEalpha-type domain-containing protein n=1 Tax=Capitella teleta TaxID=283909 RepID=R7TXU0_CAPTE|nr:hypothetical protein CAPTEDRAFT_176545 [Capitella teleta]|eukprot:ELT98422.1 hypothetical protein CAPTEDRAFT_176545 [Capitella teleta]
MATAAVEPEVLTEVPDGLKRLVRYIVRGFYSVEHAILLDFLVHHPCVKEDDLLDLLLFERKQLRALVNTLKAERFIKSRMKMETDQEGRISRHNYFFINYGTFVNVVKYKMDHMRRKIETEERDNTHRASFQCSQCQKSYTDLEVDHLIDFASGQLHCEFCGAEVKEEEASEPRRDSRSLMEMFNTQMTPVDKLLRGLDDVTLAQELLEPEPTDLKSLRPKESSSRSGERTTWSGDASKGKDFNYVSMDDQVTISLGGDETKKAATVVTKETPIWMTQSTVEGSQSEAFLPETSSKAGASSAGASGSQENDDIMKTLLMHEKKSTNDPMGGLPREDTSSSESEDDFQPAKPAAAAVTLGAEEDFEEMESDDEEAVAMVMIGGQQVAFNEVSEEMIAKMTPSEKEAYIKLGQDMYEDMYD